MNAFALSFALANFVYDASSHVEANQLNYLSTAMLPLVPTFPSYEEFLDSSVGSPLESNLPLLNDPRLRNNMEQTDGGDFGEEGCAHLNKTACDGKLETMIEKGYWMLYMASPAKEHIDLDTVACVDRCVCDYCKVVRTKFTFSDDGSYVQDLWGTDGQYLIYLKQTIMLESQKFYIFRSKVEDIQKGDIHDQKSTSPVVKKDALTQILQSASFVILGGQFDQFIVFRSCSKSNPVVFVYVKEEAYLRTDDEKKQMLHEIDVILYNNRIDNRVHIDRLKNNFCESATTVFLGSIHDVGSSSHEIDDQIQCPIVRVASAANIPLKLAANCPRKLSPANRMVPINLYHWTKT